VARPTPGAHALVMPTRPLFLLLALATTPCVARSADPGSPEAPIRAQVERFVSAWNEHDMRALSRLFADDADFVNVVGIWWKSRREIEAAHVATHQTLFKSSTLSGQVASVKLLRPDVAVVHAAWTLIGSRAPDGQPMPERKGILVFVLTRESEGWTIRAAQNTDIIEGALAPPPPAAGK
jgi:uncharacterized protein (TIGR02246 family)